MGYIFKNQYQCWYIYIYIYLYKMYIYNVYINIYKYIYIYKYMSWIMASLIHLTPCKIMYDNSSLEVNKSFWIKKIPFFWKFEP